MFSRASLKKSSPLIPRVLSNQPLIITRPLSNQSQASYGENTSSKDEETFLKFFRSFSSGIAIAGTSFSFLYWFSSTSNVNPFLSFADSPSETFVGDKVIRLENAVPEEKNSKFLFGESYRKRVFFNYEKRIRMQSPPEKVFDYFASYKTEGGDVLMTPADLMRAVVPVFPPTESNRVREGFLRGERVVPSELQCAPSKFFMLFDTNSDGLISFPEYIFFVTLLSIPESSFSIAFKMFDLDNNGQIDRDEFKKVMNLMRYQNRQGARHRDGRRGGLKVVGEKNSENGGVIEYFFGKDGNAYIQHEKFVQFLRDLHEEILRLEFAHYDCKSRGTISAKDFALSVVASADIGHINKLLDRVDELDNEENLREIRVTFQEFKDFAELRKKLQYLSMAIFTYGKVSGSLTKKDFQRAASQVCGVYITDNVIDLIFHVFDADRDGSLSSDEFVRVLQRREKENVQPRESGFKGLISCWMNCTTNCSSAKHMF